MAELPHLEPAPYTEHELRIENRRLLKERNQAVAMLARLTPILTDAEQLLARLPPEEPSDDHRFTITLP